MIRVRLTFFILLLPIKNPPRWAGQKCKRPLEAAFCAKRGRTNAPRENPTQKQRLGPVQAGQESPGITILDSTFRVIFRQGAKTAP